MWKYAWREIIRRKKRSTAAIFSYGLAVVIFIVLISLLRSSDQSMYQTLKSTGTHFIAFKPVCCNFPLLKNEINEGFWANGSRSQPMPIELVDTIKNLSSVADASPFLLYLFRDTVGHSSFTIAGFIPENRISVANTTCATTDIIDGRFLTSQDTNAIMLEQSFAVSHYLGVGKVLTIEDRTFCIVGVVNAGIRPAKADVYMPYRQAEEVISLRTWNPIEKEMNIVLVESANAEMHKQAMQDVIRVLGKENLISTYACYNPASTVISLNRETLWLLTILIGIFICVHVLRTQYASIVERNHEIGILYSMGWSRRRIISLIGSEFIIQATLGGILGCVVGMVLQVIFSASPMLLSGGDSSLEIILWGFGTAFSSALLSGYSAALFATATKPMNNLRTV